MASDKCSNSSALLDIYQTCCLRNKEERPSSKSLLKEVDNLYLKTAHEVQSGENERKLSVESVRSIPSPPPPPPVPHSIPTRPKIMPENDTSAESSPVKEQPFRRTFSVTQNELKRQKERLKRTQLQTSTGPAGESKDLTSVMKEAIFQRRDSVWQDQGQTTASSHDEQSPCESPW